MALLRCNGSPGCFDSGLQVICIVGSGVSHLPLDNTRYILYGVQVRRVCCPIKHSNTMVIEPAFGTFGSVGSPAVKWNQHLHKACQQMEAWSALKCPDRWLRWLWTSGNTVDQHQQMPWQPKSSLTVETSHWTSSNMDSVSLHSSSRLWDLDFQMKCKMYFHLKRVHWTTKQQSSFFFSLAQVRCFWRCFCFRSGLVALFLKMSERGDSWCTDSSFSSLLVKLSQVFESALLNSILKLAVIPVACAHFPTQFLPSSQLYI